MFKFVKGNLTFFFFFSPWMRGTGNHETHPVVTILKRVAEVHESKDCVTPVQAQLIQLFPNLNKSQIMKLSSLLKAKKRLRESLEECEIAFHFDENSISILNQNIFQKGASLDLLLLSTVFACVAWSLDNEHKREISEFSALVQLLIHFSNNEEKMMKINIYGFKKILKTSLKQSSMIWNENTLNSVISFLMLNNISFEQISFNLIYRLFQNAIFFGSNLIVSSFMNLIYGLLEKNINYVTKEDLISLSILLKPYVEKFDEKSLNVLSIITQKYELNSCLNLFENIGKDLTELISNQVINDGFNYIEESVQNTIKYCDLFNKNMMITISNVIKCLKNSLDVYITKFVSVYFSYTSLELNDIKYIYLCIGLTKIMEQIEINEYFSNFLSIIINERIFSHSYTIYNNNLNCLTNFLRNKIIKIIIKSGSNILYLFLTEFDDNDSLLQIENIIRFISYLNSYKANILLEDDILNLIVKSTKCIRKRKLESKEYEKAYIDSLYIFSKIANNPLSFLNQEFFAFSVECIDEEDYSNILLEQIREILSRNSNDDFNNISSFLNQFIKKCYENSCDNKYVNLSINLTNIIKEALLTNTNSYKYLNSIIPNFFSLLNVIHKKKLIFNCLTILEIENQNNPSGYMPKEEYLKIFGENIKIIEKNEPSQLILHHIDNLLSISLNSSPQIIIKRPQFFVLYFYAYENSGLFAQMIKRIKKLCKFSFYNYYSCSKGELDKILMDFILLNKEEGEVNLRNLKFLIKISFDDLINIVIPFLFKIISKRTNNSIMKKFLDIINCKNKDIKIKFLYMISYYLRIYQKLIIDIGTFSSNLIMKNVSKSFLKNLKIDFNMLIDFQLIILSNAQLNLITIYDDYQQIHLQIFIKNRSIFVRYKESSDFILKQMIRSIPNEKSYIFSFSISSNPNDYNIEININNKISKINKLKLKVDDMVNIDFGKCDISNSEYKNVKFGTISNIKLNNNYIEKHENTSTDVKNYIPYFMKFLLVSDFPKILFSNFNDLYDHLDVALDIISQLYLLNPSIQESSNIAKLFSYNLSMKINLIDEQLYSSIVSVIHYISNSQVLNDWLEFLVFNIELWSKSNSQFFRYVLNYLNFFVSISVNLIKQVSLFKKLLNSYIKLFSENSNSFLNYSNDDIISCQNLFQKLLEKIAFMKIEDNDIKYIFSYLIKSKSIPEILSLLKIINNVEKNILSSNYNIIANRLFYFLSFDNIDIIEIVIYLLNKTSNDQLFETMTTAAIILSNSKFNKIIFEKFNLILQEIPNVHFLLSLLSLSLGEKYIHMHSSSLYILSTEALLSSFSYIDFWYIFSLFVALSGSQDDKKIVGYALSNIVLHSPHPIHDIGIILDIIELVESVIHSDFDFSYIIYMKLLSSTLPDNIFEYCFYRFFISIFFHFVNPNDEITPLQSEFNKSIFSSHKNDLTNETPKKILPIDEIISIFHLDFNDYLIKFGMKPNALTKIDSLLYLYQKANKIFLDFEPLIKVLQYYKNKTLTNKENYLETCKVMEHIQIMYNEKFKKDISIIKNMFLQKINSILLKISNASRNQQ